MRRCYVCANATTRAQELERDTRRTRFKATLNGKTKHSNMATGNLQEKHPQHNYYCYSIYHTIQRCFFSMCVSFSILISVYFELLQCQDIYDVLVLLISFLLLVSHNFRWHFLHKKRVWGRQRIHLLFDSETVKMGSKL